MGFIQSIIDKHKEKIKIVNEECDNLICQIESALSEINFLFKNRQEFIDPCMGEQWYTKNFHLISKMQVLDVSRFRKAANIRKIKDVKTKLCYYYGSLKEEIRNHNNSVASYRIENAYKIIGNVEGITLDRQQMICIVNEAHNHLVIAGAGTGKTTTIVGKIKFLLNSGKYKPEDILVLSFTNASANEMSHRINMETNCYIEASTFHKLGINIITKVEGIVPKITKLDLHKFIKDQLIIYMNTDSYLNMLCLYLLHNRVVSRSEFDFKTKEEYDEYLKLNPPTTIKNEKVKSYGEMDIANFLIQNGIKYIYEHPYKLDTRTSKYGQYYPDFYLPDYDIYIEYFGINKNGEVPSYFNGESGMSATDAYQASMKWKRELHVENSTAMIECFAYEKFDGVLIDNLKKNLLDKSVKITPVTTQELWKQVSEDSTTVLNSIADLFATVINLIKSNGYSFNKIKQLNVDSRDIHNNNIILYLLEPIYNEYCLYLERNNEIDFNDMINKAAWYVNQGKYLSSYKYVIVDEYQDISKARFSLLKSLRNSNNFDLFCVGDDWQSIYRFAGSDISFIINFEKYWGAAEISRIETTYRFTQSLIDISGNFIMQNPLQIRKAIRGNSDTSFALEEINGYNDKFSMEFMVNKLNDLPQNSSVFFIGRYQFDLELLKNCAFIEYQYNKNGFIDIIYNKRKDLKMSFITAHRSKGLQSDYVFIINNKNSKMGFPSKMQDAPILNLLLDNCDKYPYAEERRLFYVALTRAKKKAFVVTVKKQESEFIVELKKNYERELRHEKFKCPLCGGTLIKRFGRYGEFFGCSNYRTKGCKYIRKISK